MTKGGYLDSETVTISKGQLSASQRSRWRIVIDRHAQIRGAFKLETVLSLAVHGQEAVGNSGMLVKFNVGPFKLLYRGEVVPVPGQTDIQFLIVGI